MKYLVQLNGIEYEVEVEKGNAEIVTSHPIAAAAAPAAEQPAPAAMAAPPAAPAPVAAAPAPAPAPPAPVAAAPPPVASGSGDPIKAPLPGNMWKVLVTPGQAVNAGDTLAIIEAMKMENEILAPRAGTIIQVMTKEGDVVETNDLLMTIQ